LPFQRPCSELDTYWFFTSRRAYWCSATWAFGARETKGGATCICAWSCQRGWAYALVVFAHKAQLCAVRDETLCGAIDRTDYDAAGGTGIKVLQQTTQQQSRHHKPYLGLEVNGRHPWMVMGQEGTRGAEHENIIILNQGMSAEPFGCRIGQGRWTSTHAPLHTRTLHSPSQSVNPVGQTQAGLLSTVPQTLPPSHVGASPSAPQQLLFGRTCTAHNHTHPALSVLKHTEQRVRRT
jgi:hypothetical protein